MMDIYALLDSSSCFVLLQFENLDVERQRNRGEPSLVHHGRQVVLVLRLEPEVLQEAREEEENLCPGQPLPRADPLAHRERDEELAPLDLGAAGVEKPLRPKDVSVVPRVPREQGLYESLGCFSPHMNYGKAKGSNIHPMKLSWD